MEDIFQVTEVVAVQDDFCHPCELDSVVSSGGFFCMGLGKPDLSEFQDCCILN